MNTDSTPADAETETIEWLERRRVTIEPVTIDALVGVDHALDIVRSVIGRLRHPEGSGSPVPRNLLLSGPPGTGKTLISRVLAGEAGAVPAYDLPTESMTPDQIRAVFAWLQGQPRSVVFLPEIDLCIGLDRASYLGDPESRRGLVALLEALDGLRPVPAYMGPIVVATTNRSYRLDEALKRRLGTEIVFRLPGQSARVELVALLTGQRFGPVDGVLVAALTRGWSQAAITAAVEEAHGRALYERGPGALGSQDELLRAIRRAGRAEEVSDVSPEDRRRTAIHEAGHAVVARVLGLPIGSLRIDEDPRNGRMDYGREEREVTAGDLRLMAIAALGGAAAETVVLGTTGMGGARDVRTATELLLTRIEAGADEAVPPISREPWGTQVPEMLGQLLAERVTTCLGEARTEAETVIRNQCSAVQHIAGELDAKELLAGEDLERVMKEAGL